MLSNYLGFLQGSTQGQSKTLTGLLYPYSTCKRVVGDAVAINLSDMDEEDGNLGGGWQIVWCGESKLLLLLVLLFLLVMVLLLLVLPVL